MTNNRQEKHAHFTKHTSYIAWDNELNFISRIFRLKKYFVNQTWWGAIIHKLIGKPGKSRNINTNKFVSMSNANIVLRKSYSNFLHSSENGSF